MLDVISELRYYFFYDKILSRQRNGKNIQQANFNQATAGYSAYCAEKTGNA
jgi:hypothetical protein